MLGIFVASHLSAGECVYLLLLIVCNSLLVFVLWSLLLPRIRWWAMPTAVGLTVIGLILKSFLRGLWGLFRSHHCWYEEKNKRSRFYIPPHASSALGRHSTARGDKIKSFRPAFVPTHSSSINYSRRSKSQRRNMLSSDLHNEWYSKESWHNVGIRKAWKDKQNERTRMISIPWRRIGRS